MSVRIGKVNPEKFTIYPRGYIFNGDDDSELVSVCLNKSFVRMLQSQSGRYEWWGAYRTTGDSGERAELSPGEVELIQQGIYQLFFGLVDGCSESPPPPCPGVECDNSELIELVNQLRRKLKMCGCGNNCCCEQDGWEFQPPENIDDDVTSPPVSNEVGDNEMNASWCRRFSWFVAAWVGTVGAVSEGASLGIVISGSWIESILGAKLGSLGLYIAGIVQTIVQWIAGNTTWQGMFNALNQADVLQALVCAVYTSSTPLEAKERFKAVISEVDATWYQKLMINLWRGLINWNLIYSEAAWGQLESQFPQILTTPLNCNCGGEEPPPDPIGTVEEVHEIDDGWFLVAMNLHEPADSGNSTLVESGFVTEWSTIAPTDITASSKLRSELLTSPVLDNSGSVYAVPSLHGGYFWLNVEVNDNARLGAFAAEACLVTEGSSGTVLSEVDGVLRLDTGFVGVTEEVILGKLELFFGITNVAVNGRLNFSSSANAASLRFRRGASSTINPYAKGVIYAILNESVLDLP